MKRFFSLLMLTAMPLLLAAEEGKSPPASLVVTAPVTQGVINPLQTFVGTLYYDKKSDLASQYEGIVESFTFREGQHIRKGETLVRLDCKVLEASVAAKASALKAMEAELTRQERDMERSKALFERDSISQSGYDQVFYATEQLRDQVAATRSELEALRIQLRKHSIKAPFNGVVSTRNVEVGEWVAKGATVATLVDPGSIEAHVNIPARLVDILRKAKRFHATVEGHDIEVSLKSVIPVADAATRTFPVELALPAGMELIEGMRIDIRVPTLDQIAAFLVPRDAVIKRFGQTVVFAAVDGKAVMMPVEVVGYKTDLAAIAGAGLKEQMRVVIKGNERIFPNMPVVEKE